MQHKSVLSYVSRVSSCPMCLHALRAHVSYVPACRLRTCHYFFSCLTCLQFFTCLTCLYVLLTCLHFFTCLIYPYYLRALHALIFTCLMYLHFITYLTSLHFFTCLHFLRALRVFISFACLHFYTCLQFIYVYAIELTQINELTYGCSSLFIY